MSDITLTADQLRDISDYLTNQCNVAFHEDDDLGVFRTYSGRGMYGKSCIGITLDGMNAAWEVAMNLIDALNTVDLDDEYETIEAFKRPSQDSMGYGMIIYWPSIGLESDEDADESDEDEDAATTDVNHILLAN